MTFQPTSIVALAVRELKRLLKDPNLILVIFVAPLAYAALYGAIYWNKVETDLPVDVVDLDRSTLSRSLVRDIDALQQVRVATVSPSESEYAERMRHGTVHAAVIIPAHFSRDIKAGKTASVHMILSPGRLLVLSDIGINLAKTVATFGGKVTGRVLAAKGLPVIQHPDLVQPLSFSWSPLYNPWLTYGDMILPALMAIILLQLVLVGSAAATASEYSTNGWREVFTDLRAGSTKLVVGKLLMFVAIFLGFALLLRVTIIPLFNIRITGSAVAIILLLVLAFAAAAVMGLFAGSFFRHRISTFIVLGFTSYPFFMLSGYAWPDAQLPWLLQILAKLLPTTPFLKGILYVTQTGGGISKAMPALLNLSVLIVLYGTLARMRFAFIARQFRGDVR